MIRSPVPVAVATLLSVGCFDSTQPIVPAADVDVQLFPVEDADTSWAVTVARNGSVVGYVVDDQGRSGFTWSGDSTVRLGTLGGPESNALDINASGWVVGASELPTRGRHGFLYRNGILEDLGTLGGDSSFARAINDVGTIVGWSTDASETRRAVRWAAGTVTLLGPAGVPSEAREINDNGQIMGWIEPGNGQRTGFVWSNGTLTDLGSLGGDHTTPHDMNEAGVIVGGSATTNSGDCSQLVACHAFRWEAGTLTDLGTLGGHDAVARAINDRGDIVGNSETGVGGVRAFLWSASTRQMVDLGTLGGNSFATGINNLGVVIGHSMIASVGHAYAWRDGQIRILRTMGLPGSRAWDINSANQIVGVTGAGNGQLRGIRWVLRE